MSQKLKINVTFQWETTKKEWDNFISHRNSLKSNPTMVLQEDPVSTFHYLRDLGVPDITSMTLVPVTNSLTAK